MTTVACFCFLDSCVMRSGAKDLRLFPPPNSQYDTTGNTGEMPNTSAQNLRQAVGSLLVAGLSGPELTSLERAWLRLLRPAGVILFRRNIKDAEQTRALLDEATGLCTRHSVRYVDVEGGTVNRLRDALAPLPSAQAVGAAVRQQDKPKL